MNQTVSQIKSFFSELDGESPKVKAWIAPQNFHLSLVQEIAPSFVKVGAQNIYKEKSGAFTGENSPEALKDLGAHFTLIGHSERRQIFGEVHKLLNEKVKLALSCGLHVIFCVGETLEERKAGATNSVLEEQLKEGLAGIQSSESLMVAYEPVWAIGTGEVATPAQAEEAHQFIFNTLESLDLKQIPLLYGGSVKPDNAKGLLRQPHISGALVGGASLKAQDFSQLVKIAASLS